ncbi:phosphoglucosamine mutase [Hyphobacterium sp. CCMP332]|nr:phosphoglucosamine mutase [Hyphobacterium sp. CCMP332]
MALIKSISGIRGTIGGKPSENLTPIDIVLFTSAFGTILKREENAKTIIIGRDARPSGDMVSSIVASTLTGLGLNVIDLGISTTPTVEMAVANEKADGGIIITASHNPVQWNALKLLNGKGEFISGQLGEKVLQIAERADFDYADVMELGSFTYLPDYVDKHIAQILDLPLVDKALIASRNFKIVVDSVNSSGGIAIPRLLNALGLEVIKEINCQPTGFFAHNPEPLPENLKEISETMQKGNYDLGIVVDPDVDRLALICEDGSPFGEEYTLVAVSDYILQNTPGNTVSNMSSTRALRDITEKHGQSYAASAVGEVNVVEMMKETKAIIGGEGNGGIIYPELHYGRDALVGIALFLTHLAKFDKPVSALRASYPNYVISKNKIELTADLNVDEILKAVKNKYSDQKVSTIDGVKIDFENEWIHLRKSNTEPIIRIYAESNTIEKAEKLAESIMKEIRELSKSL